MAIKKFNTDYEEGDIVFLKTDPYQFDRVVIGYSLMSGVIRYLLAAGEATSSHLGIEITSEPVEPRMLEEEQD